MPTTLEIITRIAAEQLGLPESDVKPDSRFVADLGADSLDAVELLMAIEDYFALHVEDDSLATVTTAAEAAALVDSLRGTAACADVEA